MSIKGNIEIEIQKVKGMELNEGMIGIKEIKKHILTLLDKLAREETKYMKKQGVEVVMTARFDNEK